MAGKRNSPGDGTLRQRSDGTWEYRVPMTLSDGSPSRKSFYSHDKTGAGAKKKYRDWLAGNEDPLLKIKTFGEWALTWLEIYKKGNIAPKSYANYKLYIEKHINPAIGPLKMNTIRPAHIEKLMSNKTDLSNSARHHILMTINAIFESAIDNHYCSSNPCKKVKLAKLSTTAPTVFTQDELDQILINCYTIPGGFYVAALLYTGLRIGELCALQWGNVNLKEGVIIISQSVATTESKGKVYGIKTTKTDKVRTVALTDAGLKLFELVPKKGLFVFPGKGSNFITPDTFRKRYDKFFFLLNTKLAAENKDAAEEPFQVRCLSPHKCRHTHATYLLKGGCNIRAVQEQLGHAKLTTTEIYTHVDIESQKENIKKLAF